MNKRLPDALVRQAETFLHNLGAAQSLDFILHIDPIFAKFMKDECGLDLEKLKEVSFAAAEASNTLKRQDGIVTEANCEKFLKTNNAYGDPWNDTP